jgi:hypothetical protein
LPKAEWITRRASAIDVGNWRNLEKANPASGCCPLPVPFPSHWELDRGRFMDFCPPPYATLVLAVVFLQASCWVGLVLVAADRSQPIPATPLPTPATFNRLLKPRVRPPNHIVVVDNFADLVV